MDQHQWQCKGAGHRQRLRDKFLEHGLDGFSDAEVLELLLSFGTPRTDCKEPARALLGRFDSLAAVLDAEAVELRELKGIGPKNVFALAFVTAVADRYLKQRLKTRCYLNCASEVVKYLRYSLGGRKVEAFVAVFLDGSHGIIDTEVMAEGTVNCNTVYPREIIRRAIAYNAVSLIVAHNHPSGALRPSPQDLDMTRNLFLACSLMQIRLLDHLIIGSGYYSLADHGQLEEAEAWSRRVLSGMEAPQPAAG